MNKEIKWAAIQPLTGGMYFGEKGRKQTELGEAAYDVEQYAEKEVERSEKESAGPESQRDQVPSEYRGS